ncbi:MAG: rubrerythrin family protein [Defluviitaleaceae bacterium]|nr:rubrerythrin family protein [Defluviitaleaceae bacterium]
MTAIEGLKGTQTEKNLQSAFAGESQARNRYSYYAEIAKGEGFSEIADFFERNSKNEMFHAKTWYKLLKFGRLPNVIECLEEAIAGESAEHETMYPQFAEIAEKEGFSQIASLFREVAKIEKSHEEHCKKMLEKLKNSSYMNELASDMVCTACGFDFRERDDLEECPVCGSASDYFAVKL